MVDSDLARDYDSVSSKFCSSLLWFVCRLSENGYSDIPPDITNPLELSSSDAVVVKPVVADFLASGSMYLNFANMYLNEPVYSVWDLIQRLSHKGIYVMDANEDAVTDQDIHEKFPFNMTSHLSLMDSLMLVYSNNITNMQIIVNAIRSFTTYNASKELPFDLEDALLLWLNKINKVNTLEYSRSLTNKQQFDQHNVRLDKHKLVEKHVFPLLTDIGDCFKDGISPLSLLLFYLPNHISIDSIKLAAPLSMDERLANIELFRAICADHVCTSVFALPVEDFFHSKEVFKQNFIALLSEMFVRLEDIRRDKIRELPFANPQQDERPSKGQEGKPYQPLLSKRSKQQLAKLEQATLSQEHNKALQVDDLEMHNSQMFPSTIHRGQLQYASHAWEGNSSHDSEKNKQGKISLNFRPDSGSSFRSGIIIPGYRSNYSPDAPTESESNESHDVNMSMSNQSVSSSAETYIVSESSKHEEHSVENQPSTTQNNLSYSDGVKLVENALFTTLNKQSRDLPVQSQDKPHQTSTLQPDDISRHSYETNPSFSTISHAKSSFVSDDVQKSLNNQASLSSIYSISSLSDEFSDNLIYQQNPAYAGFSTTEEGDEEDDALSTITEATEPEAPSLYSFHSSSTSTVNESGDERYQSSPAKGSFTASPAKSKLEDLVLPEETADDLIDAFEGTEFPAHIKAMNHIMTSSLSESTETLEDGGNADIQEVRQPTDDVLQLSDDVQKSSELDKTLTEDTEQKSHVDCATVRESYTVSPSTEEIALAHGLPIIEADGIAVMEGNEETLRINDKKNETYLHTEDQTQYRSSSETSDEIVSISMRYPSENSIHSFGTHSSSSGIVEDDGRINCMSGDHGRVSDEHGRVSHMLYSSLSETTPSPDDDGPSLATTSDNSNNSSVVALNDMHSPTMVEYKGDKTIHDRGNKILTDKTNHITTQQNGEKSLSLDFSSTKNCPSSTFNTSELFGHVNFGYWPFIERNNNHVKSLYPSTNSNIYDDLPSPVKTSWREIMSRQGMSDMDVESEFQKVRLRKSVYKSTQKTWKDFVQFSTPQLKESRDEPLSSRLAALRMQLEEKRRQFEEEKKRKQEEWSQERAKMLTTAYLQMNGKENEDPEMLTKPTGLTSWEVHFDSTPAKTETTEAPANSSVPMAKYDGPSKPYVSPREYIRQKQLEQKQSSNDGLWFVNFDKDDDLSVEQNRHEFNSLQQDQSQEKFFRPTSDTGNNFYSPPDHQSAHVARSNEHEVTNLAHFSEHKSRTEAFEYTTIHFPYSRDPIESRSVSKQTSNFSQRPSKEETLEQRPQYKQRISSDEITSTSSDSLSRLRALRDVTSDISGHFSRQNATMTSASYQEPRFWWENSQENRPNTSPSYRHHENVSSSHVTSLQNNKSLSGGDFVMSPSSPASSYRSANSVPNTPRQKTDEFHSAKRFDYSSHPELSTRLTDHARENILTDHAHENMLKESHGYHQLPHLIMERNDDVMKQATHDDFHISPVQDGTSSTQHPDQNHVEDSSQCHSDHEGNELVLNLIRSSISQSEHSDSLSDYTPLSNQNAFADHAEKGVDFNHPPPYTPIDDTSYSHNEIHNAYDDRVHLPPSQNYTHVSNNQEELTSFKEHSLDVSSRQPVAIFTNDNRYRATEQAHNGVTDQSQLTNSETISSVVTNNSQSLASSQISAHIKIDSVTSDHSFDERSNVEVITKTIGEPTSSENVFSTPKKEVTGESSVGVITPSTGGAATTPSTGEENAANDKPTAWALNFGNQFESPEMTPEQKKKRDRFIRNRQKKQEEERAKKEAEQEKKRKKEERLAEQKQKEEEERMREIERRKQIELEEETSLLQQEGYSKRIHGMTYETNTPERHTNRPFSHRLPPRENAERSNHPRVQSANAATPPRRFGHGASGHGGSSEHLPSQFSEYKGPSVYQKPSGKSNRKIIQNAVMHCCLCGEVNKEAKNKCLEAINQSDGNHFLVLFREGLKFRSVYEYNPDHETVTRIYGIGPKSISGKMIVKYYKYNSGGKEFNELDTKHLSIQIDGIMIKKELWEKKQGPSKVDSNLARKKFTPRATGSGVNR